MQGLSQANHAAAADMGRCAIQNPTMTIIMIAIGSIPYMVCHLPSIYPSHVSINLPCDWILWVLATGMVGLGWSGSPFPDYQGRPHRCHRHSRQYICKSRAKWCKHHQWCFICSICNSICICHRLGSQSLQSPQAKENGGWISFGHHHWSYIKILIYLFTYLFIYR